ncbi:MAG: hypothetical protein CL429_03020 [Acidimicrobiaceae bacterium]|nr:hypothetical protein [Acidimicrobiaceae bacterium]
MSTLGWNAASDDSDLTKKLRALCLGAAAKYGDKAVVTEALEIIKSGERKIVSFGYSDDEAFAVGLTCGGTINLYIEPFDW